MAEGCLEWCVQISVRILGFEIRDIRESTLIKIAMAVAVSYLSLALLILAVAVAPSESQYTNCKENGLQQCKEFLGFNICGRLIWCYKREPVGNLSTLCTFSDTKFTPLYFNAEGPPVPNPKKCTLITDTNDDCYKLCNQIKDTTFPFLGIINVCLQQSQTYSCTSSKSGKTFCACAQLANADVLLKQPTAKQGTPCSV